MANKNIIEVPAFFTDRKGFFSYERFYKINAIRLQGSGRASRLPVIVPAYR